jgi:hypothetical protein
VAHGHISHCLIQKREGTANNYTDIKVLSGCNLWKIHDNHFRGTGDGGDEDGIVIESDSGNSFWNIHNNTFEDRAKAIWLKANANNIYVSENVGVANVATLLFNEATAGNVVVFKDNYPYTNNWKSLAGATPSVEGSEYDYFLTANGSSTTITNFLHGLPGQVIRVVANDANTTVQHNTKINLQGGSNFVMGAGAVLSLVYQKDGDIWREVGRRT